MLPVLSALLLQQAFFSAFSNKLNFKNHLKHLPLNDSRQVLFCLMITKDVYFVIFDKKMQKILEIYVNVCYT